MRCSVWTVLAGLWVSFSEGAVLELVAILKLVFVCCFLLPSATGVLQLLCACCFAAFFWSNFPQTFRVHHKQIKIDLKTTQFSFIFNEIKPKKSRLASPTTRCRTRREKNVCKNCTWNRSVVFDRVGEKWPESKKYSKWYEASRNAKKASEITFFGVKTNFECTKWYEISRNGNKQMWKFFGRG